MDTLRFDLQKPGKPFKLLNCTNGGPIKSRFSNVDDYKAARIPYSRNHDAAMVSAYGGPFCHDISRVFPNFDADEEDPACYDFACTDDDIRRCLSVGTKTYYRLGQTIEHQVKKHFTVPPKDFHKWARICEHVIRHYTEGWADGFHYDMPYWEIWNEPDLDPDDSDNKRCWGGTKAEFFDFFEIAAKHLKACFPHLKIGGPAIARHEDWAEDFLTEMHRRGVALDFFSWHRYTRDVDDIIGKSYRIRAIMDKCGYKDAESICNEWAYINSWTVDFAYTVERIHDHKGASYIMAVICAAQQAPIDLLMYYDTRVSYFNACFDYYTQKLLPGYYSLYYYGQLYDAKYEIASENTLQDVYTLCGVDDRGKAMGIVTYYNNDDAAPNKQIAVDFGRSGEFEAFIVDKDRLNEAIDVSDGLKFDLKVNSFVYFREK